MKIYKRKPRHRQIEPMTPDMQAIVSLYLNGRKLALHRGMEATRDMMLAEPDNQNHVNSHAYYCHAIGCVQWLLTGIDKSFPNPITD
jgi:hypothetical protein